MIVAKGEAIVRAARGCIGAHFRPQGRDPATGLDCVGLVAIAFAGRLRGVPPADYAQRGGDEAGIAVAIGAAGFTRIAAGEAVAGDLLLLATGPGQWHLAIGTGCGFIHADARLRRVTEVPGRPHWPIAGIWRLGEGES